MEYAIFSVAVAFVIAVQWGYRPTFSIFVILILLFLPLLTRWAVVDTIGLSFSIFVIFWYFYLSVVLYFAFTTVSPVSGRST